MPQLDLHIFLLQSWSIMVFLFCYVLFLRRVMPSLALQVKLNTGFLCLVSSDIQNNISLQNSEILNRNVVLPHFLFFERFLSYEITNLPETPSRVLCLEARYNR